MSIYEFSPLINALIVFGPNTPSITRPASFWNSLIAFLVSEPLIPSISPV